MNYSPETLCREFARLNRIDNEVVPYETSDSQTL
jgi:hypothetical protein